MKKVKIFADHIEPSALSQFKSAMEQDFSIQGALMPDAHTGYSLPIGGVIATDGVVLPAWVGYDIGCGMCALPTSFAPSAVTRKSKSIFKDIYRCIPVGFNVNKHQIDTNLDPDNLTNLGRKQAKRQLNTNEFKATMQGITAKVGASTLDESPMAYKDIFEVMQLQSDLVEVVHHITPIINVKG